MKKIRHANYLALAFLIMSFAAGKAMAYEPDESAIISACEGKMKEAAGAGIKKTWVKNWATSGTTVLGFNALMLNGIWCRCSGDRRYSSGADFASYLDIQEAKCDASAAGAQISREYVQSLHGHKPGSAIFEHDFNR